MMERITVLEHGLKQVEKHFGISDIIHSPTTYSQLVLVIQF
jgi:hypothetical protein